MASLKAATAPRDELQNDDIGLDRRLELFRVQVEIRDCEKRALDLFLQNMIKGTSHLSIGQEAVAAGFGVAMRKGDKSFCTYRGHAHTLARGAPMEGILGELMLRDIGLMRGKGGSMHLTSVEHDVLGSYAIIGAHLPIACGSAWRAQYRRGLEAAGRVRLREQPLHGIHADRRGDRGRASRRRQGGKLWPRAHH